MLVCLHVVNFVGVNRDGRDSLLVIGNVLVPAKPARNVVPEGHPGSGGKWPEYVQRKEGDSRCSCPGLNALANHGKLNLFSTRKDMPLTSETIGIIPRDGKNIRFVDINVEHMK